jgi:hypothetical protein
MMPRNPCAVNVYITPYDILEVSFRPVPSIGQRYNPTPRTIQAHATLESKPIHHENFLSYHHPSHSSSSPATISNTGTLALSFSFFFLSSLVTNRGVNGVIGVRG